MEPHQNPIICYCAGITRDEIRQAVMMGARSREEIRLITGKTEEGNCHEKHPRGICCKKDFDEEIRQALLELEALGKLLSSFG